MFGFSLAFTSPPFRPSPALQLYFAGATTLDSRITFTRADAVTCATYFDSTGRLQTALRNELTYSEDLSNAAWSATGVTKGTSVITEDTATSGHLLARFTTWPSGVLATGAFIVSAGTATKCWIGNASAATAACFDLSTGTVEGLIGSITATITSLGSGRYLIAAQHTAAAAQTLALGIYSTFVSGNYNSTIIYLGTGRTLNVFSGGLFLGGYTAAQVQAAGGIALTTTAANSGPRFDYDPATAAGVTGPELVTNGDFSQGTTGWTAWGSGSLAVSGGIATVTCPSGNQGIQSASNITLAGGKTYKLTFNIGSVTGGAAQVGIINNGSWEGISYVLNITAPGTYSVSVKVAGGSLYRVLAWSQSTASTFTIDHISVQEVTFNPRGLLIEESRQNLLLQSRDMTQAAWTKTDVTPARTQVGIDGVANTACLMTQGSAGNGYVSQNVAHTNTNIYTTSFVFKRGNNDWQLINFFDTTSFQTGRAWFNLNTGAKGATATANGATNVSSTITALGGGWYRCTLTAQAPTGGATCTVETYSVTADSALTRVSGATYIVDCAQLEVGAFATSIIPTTTALTRAADSASMTGTNFSSWFNASAGTFVADVGSFNGNSSRAFTVSDGTSSNQLFVCTGPSEQRFQVFTASSFVVQIGGTSGLRTAATYAANDFAVSVNGGAAATDTSGSLAAYNVLRFGTNFDGTGAPLNGHIRSLRYYPTRLPNATLQALTA